MNRIKVFFDDNTEPRDIRWGAYGLLQAVRLGRFHGARVEINGNKVSQESLDLIESEDDLKRGGRYKHNNMKTPTERAREFLRMHEKPPVIQVKTKKAIDLLDSSP